MTDPAPSLEILQERLGHRFTDAALLHEALTHPSARDAGLDRKGRKDKRDNERLEFLGDAVLQLAVTERLYTAFPDAAEGRLTPWRATLVSRTAMARLAGGLGLGALLALSFGEERNDGRARSSNLANAMEAVIGAVFRDAGWETARDVVLRLLEPLVRELSEAAAAPSDAPTGNAKGDLQELLQKEGGDTPRYLCLKEEGAAHDRLYEAAVLWGEKELGRGTGKSKQEAEVGAARAALAALRAVPPSMTPGIRAAEPSDMEPLVALWRGFMDFHAAHDPAFTLAAGAEALRREFLLAQFADADTFLRVAVLEGETIGYALGGVRSRPPVFAFPRFGHISDLYVVPSRQRSGLGSLLLQDCLAWFQARGIARVEVRALTSNPVSNAFWAKHGFAPFAQESFLRLS